MDSGVIKVKPLVVGPFGANCYVIGSGSGEGIVVDPGADAKRILKTIGELGLNVKLIVATHGHMDHVGAVGELTQATGARFAMHEDDVELLSNRGSPFASLLGKLMPAPSPPDVLLKDGGTIEEGGLSFRVLHTPGHSRGGVCLLGYGAVFVGDTLFCQGIGRFDFPGASGSQLLDSIRTKLLTLPDDTAVYPGHGPSTTIGEERRLNPFLRPGIVF